MTAGLHQRQGQNIEGVCIFFLPFFEFCICGFIKVTSCFAVSFGM